MNKYIRYAIGIPAFVQAVRALIIYFQSDDWFSIFLYIAGTILLGIALYLLDVPTTFTRTVYHYDMKNDES